MRGAARNRARQSDWTRWRKGKVRPILGNPPHEPAGKPGIFFHRWRRVCDDPFRATPSCRIPETSDLRFAFLRHDGIYRSDRASLLTNLAQGAASRWSGPSQVKEHAGRLASRPSSAMSSARLFLDRVARQHCPSPLHRQAQTNMRFSHAKAKGDISTLPARGHFYFALTRCSISHNIFDELV
jgi:hypothetical protein